MTDKQDLIREIHEYVTTHGGENTATHLLVQAASAIQTQAAELEAVGAGGVQALSAAPAVAAPAAPTPEHIAAMERAWLWMDNQADQQSKGGHATFDLMMLREERDALRAAIDAAPKAAPGEPGWWRKRADEIEVQVALTGSPEAMRCYTDMRALLQAAAEAAPQQEAPLMPKGESAASKLRAMAANYPAGHLWDKLDAQACAQGAMEIEALRTAPQQEAQEPGEIPESIERMATGRYKVVPSHESMFHRWAVVAGSGTQQLYLGSEVECQNMARKFAGAFLDGAFVAMQRTAPQPAPAPLSDDTERLNWLLWKLPGDALRYVVGELSDTSSGAEFRAAIDAALAAQGGKA